MEDTACCAGQVVLLSQDVATPWTARRSLQSSVLRRPGSQVPLVVDLDGTLLHTDTLVESLFAVARAQPLQLLKMPLWLAGGRAQLKQAPGRSAPASTCASLPRDRRAAGPSARAAKRQGRRLVLATGADAKIAQAVADESGLFDARDGQRRPGEPDGAAKRDRLVAEFGERGFDYVGNSARDLPVWAAARRGLLVAPSPRLAAAAQRVTEVERVFGTAGPACATYLGAMRAQHWLKNLLLLVPLLAAHQLYDPAKLLTHALIGRSASAWRRRASTC